MNPNKIEIAIEFDYEDWRLNTFLASFITLFFLFIVISASMEGSYLGLAFFLPSILLGLFFLNILNKQRKDYIKSLYEEI